MDNQKEAEVSDALRKFRELKNKSDTANKPNNNKNRHKPTKSTKKFDKKLFTKICIGLSVFLGIVAVIGLIFTCLLAFRRDLFYPTKYPATTTKASGSSLLNIGQICQNNNQCPANAYCSLTCQCPDSYYFDSSSGSCVLALTYNAACSFDYQCNKVVDLYCNTATGKCDCYSKQYWNPRFSGGSGQITGRCQNKRGVGMSFTTGDVGVGTMMTGGYFGSQSSILVCHGSYQLNMNTGNCDYPFLTKSCSSSIECNIFQAFCANIDGDSQSKCTPFPTNYLYYGGWQGKNGFGSNCNAYTICNDFLNLKCSSMYTVSSNYGTCVCLNKYMYYNSTMCINGKRYGENCTTSSQCVPASAGFICSTPYSGATYTVCECANGFYYDAFTETCTAYKSFKATCRDNTECLDSYMSGTNLIAYGFCGYAPGGSYPKCLCIYDCYSSGGTCGLKITNGNICFNSVSVPQCYNNQYCDTSSSPARCRCPTSKYYSTTTNTCYYKSYQGDACTSNSECWSNNCASLKCA